MATLSLEDINRLFEPEEDDEEISQDAPEMPFTPFFSESDLNRILDFLVQTPGINTPRPVEDEVHHEQTEPLNLSMKSQLSNPGSPRTLSQQQNEHSKEYKRLRHRLWKRQYRAQQPLEKMIECQIKDCIRKRQLRSEMNAEELEKLRKRERESKRRTREKKKRIAAAAAAARGN